MTQPKYKLWEKLCKDEDWSSTDEAIYEEMIKAEVEDRRHTKVDSIYKKGGGQRCTKN